MISDKRYGGDRGGRLPRKGDDIFNLLAGEMESGRGQVTATTTTVAASRRNVQAGESAEQPEDTIGSLRNNEREMRGTVDIAKGIEALEAVAAAATVSQTSPGRVSATSSGDNSASSAGRNNSTIPAPSSAPSAHWRMSSKRGMAALNVAGTRRSWVWSATSTSRSATPDGRASRSASLGGPSDFNSPSSSHLIRTLSHRSESSNEREYDQGIGIAYRSNEMGIKRTFVSRPPYGPDAERFGDAEAYGEAEISSSSSSSSSSSTNSSSPERFSRARDSIGVAVRRSVSRGSPSGGGRRRTDADDGTTATIRGSSGEHNANIDDSSSISSSRRSSYRAITSRGSVPVPQARGFSAVRFQRSLARQENEEASNAAGSVEPTHGRVKTREWRTRASSLESAKAGSVDESSKGSGSTGAGGIRGGEVSVGKGGASMSPGAIRVENAELRVASRRLGEALTTAKEQAVVAEERSKELARQAASRVRQAEAQRASAEEAARGAEAKAYSLSATVQVLQGTTDYREARRSSSGDDNFAPRVIEAEVTAAYQSILQDMDMERAALQQQLAEVQKENDMLRSRAVGPRTQSFLSPPGSRDSSPLPTPRSYGRPKARGISTGVTRDRGTGGGGDAWSPERGYGHGWRGRRGHGRPASGRMRRLEDVLGTRVRLVQLVGLDELAGRANGLGSTRPCGQPPRLSRAEELRVAESSAEAPPTLDTCGRGGRDAFPWSKETALWYGLVTLIVAPSPGAIKELSKTPPAHAILLTDAALYVIEVSTSGAGEGTGGDGRGRAGGDSLCRIERRRVERLSLPLEMRALPSGDELAVRSNSVVVRLRLLSDDRGGRHDGGGRIAAAAGVERGYLWLSCESNEARGDLVEHLSQWYHKWDGKEARDDTPNDSSGEFSPSDADAASAASAAAVAAAAAAAVAASGGSFSSSEAANGSDEDDDALEVEQILMKELVEELGQERSLNVTALLLVDMDTLAPVGGRR